MVVILLTMPVKMDRVEGRETNWIGKEINVVLKGHNNSSLVH